MLTACFSPSQKEKDLVSYEDTVVATGRDGGAPAAFAPRDASAPSSEAGPAAPPMNQPEAGADAAPNMPPASQDAAADAADPEPPVKLLFPSNCKAPWEDPTKYHPDGYAAAKVHGLESNLNKDDCASCHGAKLEGCANSPSCDNCHDGGHKDGWRKDCAYCHGGGDTKLGADKLGAPPRDIDGLSEKTSLSFQPHTLHVTKERHIAYDCDTCHEKYEDALDPGHMYDDTPEKAEVTFIAGLSKDGKYENDGNCSNLYCHGDAKTPSKTIKHTDSQLKCNSCHAEYPTTGQHETHTPLAFWCSECHDTVDDTPAIKLPDQHVNGKVNTGAMPDNNMQWDGKTCTGTCHVIVYHDKYEW